MAIVSLPAGVGEVQQYSGQQGKMPHRTPAISDAPVTGSGLAAEALPNAIVPTTTALDMAVALALGRQDGLAAVFAEAEQLAGRSDVPAAVKTLLADLAALRLGDSGEPTAADVVRALRLSGLFHESARQGTPDLKGLLIALRSELATWAGTRADTIVAAAGVPTARLQRPPPLGHGGPLRGQAVDDEADLSTLDDVALARRLAGSADRALWRLFLHQAEHLASEEAGRSAGEAVAPAGHLVTELPVAGPTGTSIVGLRVETDDRRTADGEFIGRVHRVELAFDIAPLGPVTVRVGLMPGHRVAVGLWCDGDDATVRLDGEREAMSLGLTAAGLTVAGIDLHHGRPAEPDEHRTAGKSHRLDVSV